jgi:S-DNA-T family DNA segregation ATPase FtsK/SpoIIIE
VPFLLLLWCGLVLFARHGVDKLVLRALGGLVLTAMVALLLAGPDGQAGVSELAPWGAGGRLGANLSPRLQAAFGGSGRILLLAFGALVSLLLVTEWLFSTLLQKVAAATRRLWRGAGPATIAAADYVLPRPAVALAEGPMADDGDAEEDRDEKVRPARRAEPVTVPARVPALPKAETGSENDEGKAPARDRRRDEAEGDEDEVTATLDSFLDDTEDDAEEGDEEKDGERAVLLPRPKPKAKAKPKPKPRNRPGQADLPFAGLYPFPPMDLFRTPVQGDVSVTTQVLGRNSEAIVQRLASFGVQAEVVGVSVGPAVTQYELRVAEGIRVTKVTGFEPDLAAALKAVSVRVVAPIPGKDTIGIEVPNEERQIVVMRELLEQFGRAEDMAIPLFLGKDVAGMPIVEDLARMPHLLIAGTTGSGKSVCINTILLSVLMTRTPAQVRMILIDPKMVELQAYRQVPHLCCDVVTNMKKAPSVLQWAVDEMESRYARLSAAGVNHIRAYNRLGQQELQKRLSREVEADQVQIPYIVVIIDELADLMAVGQNEVEESIQRLAQKSRAVGMHVILATQRPSTDVITGVIKANLPCQIAFKVNRKIDSRVILDQNGADKLLGHGDMLYVPPGGAALVRAQGTFVADEEIQAVTRFLVDQGQRPSFLPDLVQTQSSSRPSPEQQDALYDEAVEVVLGQQRGSATLLQRALAIGYTRATRLLELMETDGLVGAFAGSKSRDVLLSLEEWRAQKAAMAEAAAEGSEEEPAVADDAEAEPETALDDTAAAGEEREGA